MIINYKSNNYYELLLYKKPKNWFNHIKQNEVINDKIINSLIKYDKKIKLLSIKRKNKRKIKTITT